MGGWPSAKDPASAAPPLTHSCTPEAGWGKGELTVPERTGLRSDEKEATRNEEIVDMENRFKAKIQVKHQIGKKKITETFQMTKLKLSLGCGYLGFPLLPDSSDRSPAISRHGVSDTRCLLYRRNPLAAQVIWAGTGCVGPARTLYSGFSAISSYLKPGIRIVHAGTLSELSLPWCWHFCPTKGAGF